MESDEDVRNEQNEKPKEESETNLRDFLFWVVAAFVFVVELVISRSRLHESWVHALLDALIFGVAVPVGLIFCLATLAWFWIGVTWISGQIMHKEIDL